MVREKASQVDGGLSPVEVAQTSARLHDDTATAPAAVDHTEVLADAQAHPTQAPTVRTSAKLRTGSCTALRQRPRRRAREPPQKHTRGAVLQRNPYSVGPNMIFGHLIG